MVSFHKTGNFILGLLFALFVLCPAMTYAQITIITTALPSGNTSNTYYATLAATGGTAPYTWQLVGGSLPAGLSLTSQGVISGVLATVTPGTPPVPVSFTIEVTDSVSNTASQSFSITVLSPGSHSLVINQLFDGGNGSTSSPYQYNYVEIFNAGPAAVDLQNWTLQFGNAGASFAASGVTPLGSLDPYKIGTTGGADGNGNYPAFTITYSAGFTANNCNPSAANSAFPAAHCWLNPGQYLLVQLGTSGSAVTSAATLATMQLQVPADLDLSGAITPGNSGPISGTTYVGHGGSALKPGPSSGMFALVNGVGVGVSCPSGLPANPKSSSVFSPLTSDFISYFAQLSGGTQTRNICWEGQSNVTIGPTTAVTGSFIMGGALHVSSSLKNTSALIRSAGNGIVNPTVAQSSLTYPSGTQLSTTATLTPCGDTDNNLTDFAPIPNGPKGQINWVLYNSQQLLTKATATTLNAPVSYTPTPCPNLNTTGPAVAASFSEPDVAQGEGGGTVTETLTVTVTPSSNPTAALFSVKVDLSGIPGATIVGAPITSATVGVPDGNGNWNYTERFTIPTADVTTLTVPITVLDDAYRGGMNANSLAPLNAEIVIGGCQPPTASSQTLQMGWNTQQSVVLNGQVGTFCNNSDTLVYAIQSQPPNGTLSVVFGNSVTYTPNPGFSGMDSFTFNVTDTTSSAGPLTSSIATVHIVVSATGVTPVLNLSCPSVSYDGNPHGCTATLAPFVVGTTTFSYNGSAIAPTIAGSYPVTASFVSSNSPSQNTSASGNLVINQATPTLKVNCPTVPYDGSSHGCTASVAGAGSYVPTGTISITYDGSSTAPTNGGVHAVVVTFTSTDLNYSSTSVNSSLTISVPLVTITVNDQTMTYGTALPVLTYTVSPSVPLQTAPTCISSTTSTTAVGTYPGAITCSGAAKVGCNFNYVAGSMTIRAAAAMVTANNQTMTAGAAVPALTFATTPNGLAFSTSPICSTTATASSAAGSYPITCAGGVAPNYTLAYTGGTMTVLTATPIPSGLPMIASLSPMNVAAGSTNLVLTVQGSGFVSGATVLWNGSTRTTTFVSATQLTATILASDLSTVGTADVAILNPAPGGTSTSYTFSIDSAGTAAGAFTVTPSNSAVTVTHGQSTTSAFTFLNLPSGAVVSAVCYNLPALGYCSYNAGTLTIGADASTQPDTYQVLVVWKTGGPLSSFHRLADTTIVYGMLVFPIGLLMLPRGRRFRLYRLSVLGVLLLVIAIGCGRNSSTQRTAVANAQVSTALTLTVK